uniref:Zinc finger CCHC-type and RNA binding motif containing 1 n=1 Tax=Ornithorhynchus anatinus TaxID=9258 RepID=A0A6I8N451_ORNAN
MAAMALAGPDGTRDTGDGTRETGHGTRDTGDCLGPGRHHRPPQAGPTAAPQPPTDSHNGRFRRAASRHRKPARLGQWAAPTSSTLRPRPTAASPALRLPPPPPPDGGSRAEKAPLSLRRTRRRRVTIMKDKDTRKSKGVAFILFLDKESAQNCSRTLNNKQLFGRVIKASIAIDNGRAAEFIRRRNYFDKSKCYECGETGHLSYACPKNMLGEREPPKKREKKKKKKIVEPEEEIEEVEESEDEGEDPTLDSLSQAIAFQQAKVEEEQQQWKPTSGEPSTSDDSRRPRIKKSAYFSDEEELSD